MVCSCVVGTRRPRSPPSCSSQTFFDVPIRRHNHDRRGPALPSPRAAGCCGPRSPTAPRSCGHWLTQPRESPPQNSRSCPVRGGGLAVADQLPDRARVVPAERVGPIPRPNTSGRRPWYGVRGLFETVVRAMDEYSWVRMRGEELMRDAEQARLASEARRLVRATDRFGARSARWLMMAVARLWRRPAGAGGAARPRQRLWNRSSVIGSSVRRPDEPE
jgi:hypothetical protein